MHGTYNLGLVVLSLVVAALASYTALDLAGRISIQTQPRLRHAWLAGGAAALGIGIWSMHFVGMLAFSLPIPMGYDPAITGCSLLIAILASWFALFTVTRGNIGPGLIAAGGTLMGLGVAGMHYTGMAAMQMHPALRYDPKLFAASILIAIAASITALWIAHTLRDGEKRNVLAKRGIAALVMGAAIAGTHYTGMAAAEFPAGARCGATSAVDLHWLAATITLIAFAILAMTLMLSRFAARTSLLTSSVAQLNGQVVHLETYDALTGLPNRKTLADRITTAIHAAEAGASGFAVLFMDLDGFKTINDSLGHSTGDDVLKAFAQRLLRCVRNGDTVARLGGDEFVVVLERLATEKEAEAMAQSILERTRKGAWTDSQPLQVTASIGIALYPRDGPTIDALLKNADAAMYEAKRGGRGTYRFFKSVMNEQAVRTLQIQSALHDGLRDGHFSLHFQPKFSANSGEMTGAEALLRLNHPDLGPVAPAEFIPIAESSGQIVEIGRWVRRQTCRHIKIWRESGLPTIQVAINLSPRQLTQPDLVAGIVEIVREEGVRCNELMFEITETAAMRDAPRSIEMIHEFQRNGFEIALDDFGTGYSSLAYLQRFRARQLKIDRLFTQGLDAQGNEGMAIVSAIIVLAHSLEMEVVAEGVETASQLTKLKALKCDQVQGFLLGRPVSAEAFGELLQQHSSFEAGLTNRAAMFTV